MISTNDNNKMLKVHQATTVLKMMANSWSNRAQVRQLNIYGDMTFDENAYDFLIDLLPFKDHPIFVRAPEEIRRKILSCGWIIYNQKTLSIETEILNPACATIISERVPGVADGSIKEVISETMIDESYHVLLVLNAIRVTSQRRSLYLNVPKYNLVKNMNELQSKYACSWQKKLILLATAIVSELFISDYLKLLSESDEIQAVNQFSVKVHREDELAHCNIFKHLTNCMYANLSLKQRNFFSEILPKPVKWFLDQELDVWQSVLKQIDFKDAGKMIRDCKRDYQKLPDYINYSNLVLLADELGITQNPAGLASFYQEGLLNLT